ncbi:glycosyltransferase family protein [Dyadobacter aurulentus]|uniref:hypothetical protein n=1 Tax=Dyadobacter sp. UC 10 TaxID=2605428 RepID=UPI0011F1CD43|nr:hypothetical protein [Dyadobacter sp. UC 10]KAA0990027.1 hypothetical protein FXO21_07575 [Dyadobacter sp. UC 10]
MVWNQQMAGEFEKLYSCCGAKPKIHITGVPRFDTYFEKRPATPSIRQKIVLFASSAPKHFPGQCQIVDDLVEYIGSNDDVLLLVRCHPADNPSIYDQYKAAKNIVIWPPATPGFWKGTSDFPPLDFLKVLSEMMYSCDVCVQVASTMRLDAAACNKPVISIAYDGKYKVPYKRSVRRLYCYSHQIPLNFLRLDYPVFSKEELFCFLDKVLAENYSAPDQRPALRKLVHYTEPRSVDSMVQYMQEWLG